MRSFTTGFINHFVRGSTESSTNTTTVQQQSLLFSDSSKHHPGNHNVFHHSSPASLVKMDWNSRKDNIDHNNKCNKQKMDLFGSHNQPGRIIAPRDFDCAEIVNTNVNNEDSMDVDSSDSLDITMSDSEYDSEATASESEDCADQFSGIGNQVDFQNFGLERDTHVYQQSQTRPRPYTNSDNMTMDTSNLIVARATDIELKELSVKPGHSLSSNSSESINLAFTETFSKNCSIKFKLKNHTFTQNKGIAPETNKTSDVNENEIINKVAQITTAKIATTETVAVQQLPAKFVGDTSMLEHKYYTSPPRPKPIRKTGSSNNKNNKNSSNLSNTNSVQISNTTTNDTASRRRDMMVDNDEEAAFSYANSQKQRFRQQQQQQTKQLLKSQHPQHPQPQYPQPQHSPSQQLHQRRQLQQKQINANNVEPIKGPTKEKDKRSAEMEKAIKEEFSETWEKVVEVFYLSCEKLQKESAKQDQNLRKISLVKETLMKNLESLQKMKTMSEMLAEQSNQVEELGKQSDHSEQSEKSEQSEQSEQSKQRQQQHILHQQHQQYLDSTDNSTIML